MSLPWEAVLIRFGPLLAMLINSRSLRNASNRLHQLPPTDHGTLITLAVYHMRRQAQYDPRPLPKLRHYSVMIYCTPRPCMIIPYGRYDSMLGNPPVVRHWTRNGLLPLPLGSQHESSHPTASTLWVEIWCCCCGYLLTSVCVCKNGTYRTGCGRARRPGNHSPHLSAIDVTVTDEVIALRYGYLQMAIKLAQLHPNLAQGLIGYPHPASQYWHHHYSSPTPWDF